MINETHIGKSYPPTPAYRVSREKIAEFAAAIGDCNLAYFGESPIAPPTFAAVVAAQAWQSLFDDPELGLRLDRTIHGDQRFEITRPLRDGDEVTATLTIDRVRSRGVTDMITVTVSISTVDAEPICDATSQLIHTRDEEMGDTRD